MYREISNIWFGLYPLSGGGKDHAEKGYGKITYIASMVSGFGGQTVPANPKYQKSRTGSLRTGGVPERA